MPVHKILLKLMRFRLRLFKKGWGGTASGERIYAIGDIHGRADLFLSLLRAIKKDSALRGNFSTRIILLGDLIDKGPSSKDVLELVQRFQHQFEAFVVLTGNHEEMLVQSAMGNGTVQNLWFENGGLATLKSYGVDAAQILTLSPVERGKLIHKAVGKKTLTWLSQLPMSYRSGDYFFCHAGIRPGRALHRQDREDLLWIRDDFLDSQEHHGAVIVHGHSEGLQVEALRNRINIDTAAYRTGVLTALGLENDCRWFLEATADL